MEDLNIRRRKPTHYVGVTGKLYPMDEYVNHGWGGIKRGFKDLPSDEYPYGVVYIDGGSAAEKGKKDNDE